MKNKEKKPLKWHHVLRFVVLPLSILCTLGILFILFCELFGIAILPQFHYLTRALSYLSISMNNLGVYFWPVVGLSAYFIFLFVMEMYAWIGLLKNKKYGIVCRFVYLTTILLIMAAVGYGYLSENVIVRTVVTGFLKNSNFNTVSSQRLLVIYGSVAIIAFMIYFGLNIVYYIKRRHVFKKPMDTDEVLEPIQPIAEQTQNVETNVEEVVEESHEKVEEVKDVVPSVEESNETSLENVTEESVAQTTNEPEEIKLEMPSENTVVEPIETVENDVHVDETEIANTTDATDAIVATENTTAVEPVVETVQPEPQGETPVASTPVEEVPVKLLYCPNCGNKLSNSDARFCTKCGTKLSD